MIRALLAKEFCEQWSIGALTLLTLVVTVLLPVGLHSSGQIDTESGIFSTDLLANLLPLHVFIWWIICALAITSALSGDREGGSSLFLLQLPIPRRRLWAIKFIAGLVTALASILTCLTFLAALNHFDYSGLISKFGAYQTILLLSSTIAGSAVAGVLVRRNLTALLLGLIFSINLLLIYIFIHALYFLWPYYLHLSFIVFLAGVVIFSMIQFGYQARGSHLGRVKSLLFFLVTGFLYGCCFSGEYHWKMYSHPAWDQYNKATLTPDGKTLILSRSLTGPIYEQNLETGDMQRISKRFQSIKMTPRALSFTGRYLFIQNKRDILGMFKPVAQFIFHPFSNDKSGVLYYAAILDRQTGTITPIKRSPGNTDVPIEFDWIHGRDLAVVRWTGSAQEKTTVTLINPDGTLNRAVFENETSRIWFRKNGTVFLKGFVDPDQNTLMWQRLDDGEWFSAVNNEIPDFSPGGEMRVQIQHADENLWNLVLMGNGEPVILGQVFSENPVKLGGTGWSPDGRYYVYWLSTINGDYDLMIWDGKTSETRHLIKADKPPAFNNGIQNSYFSPDGRFLAVTMNTDLGNAISIFNLETGDVTSIPQPATPCGWSWDNRLFFWEVLKLKTWNSMTGEISALSFPERM